MNELEIRAAVVALLGEVAPGSDVRGLKDGDDIREKLDIDSMDFLNFVIGLQEKLGVEIPEPDYPKVFTFGDCLRYLASRVTKGEGTER